MVPGVIIKFLKTGNDMNTLRKLLSSHNFWAIVLLCCVLFITNISMAFHVAFGIEQNQEFAIIEWIAFTTCLSAWVYADMRLQGNPVYFDQGFLIYLAWPITLPYYLFKSRGGRRGCLIIFLFAGLYLIALVSAMLLGSIIRISQVLLK